MTNQSPQKKLKIWTVSVALTSVIFPFCCSQAHWTAIYIYSKKVGELLKSHLQSLEPNRWQTLINVGFDLAHFALTWQYPVKAGWECWRYSVECLERTFFSTNKLILKLSSPSGGQPYDFPICPAGMLNGQGLFSAISTKEECTFPKYAPLLCPTHLCKAVCSLRLKQWLLAWATCPGDASAVARG